MAGGLRAAGPKADLSLIVADADAVAAGVFTTNVMCAAPVLYCKKVLAKNKPARAVSLCPDADKYTPDICSATAARASCTCTMPWRHVHTEAPYAKAAALYVFMSCKLLGIIVQCIGDADAIAHVQSEGQALGCHAS